MSTPYDTIEDAISTALLAEGTPFKNVFTYGAALADSELVTQIEKLANANVAPAAIVFYAGGSSNEGFAHELDEAAVFTVLVVAAARSFESATQGGTQDKGIFALLTWCRQAMHDLRNASVLNELIWKGNRRFAIPGLPLTVAAYAADFETRIAYGD